MVGGLHGSDINGAGATRLAHRDRSPRRTLRQSPDVVTIDAMDRIRGLIADPYNPRSLSARARARRWQLFMREFPDLDQMEVLDLGGVEAGWAASPVRPKRLLLVNLFEQRTDWAEAVVGDACSPPELGRFDLVFSNSVIDQVGGHWRRARFAEVVHGAADHHWIQTSYRYFPVDPYWLFPWFSSLPVSARVEVTRRWRLGHRRATDPAEALDQVLGVELLTQTELAGYFPGSRILTERLGGLPKSIVAVR
jgi:hypothetical protein